MCILSYAIMAYSNANDGDLKQQRPQILIVRNLTNSNDHQPIKVFLSVLRAFNVRGFRKCLSVLKSLNDLRVSENFDYARMFWVTEISSRHVLRRHILRGMLFANLLFANVLRE